MTNYRSKLVIKIDSMMAHPDVNYAEIHDAQLDLRDYDELTEDLMED